MSWGYRILLVYAVFVLGIMFLVFKSSSQKMDLVTTDYYARELKYQEKIDEVNRVSNLSSPVDWSITEDKLTVILPGEFSGKEIRGEFQLYCPSDEDKDVTQKFIASDNKLAINLPANYNKIYEVHLSWQADGRDYYLEKRIVPGKK